MLYEVKHVDGCKEILRERTLPKNRKMRSYDCEILTILNLRVYYKYMEVGY